MRKQLTDSALDLAQSESVQDTLLSLLQRGAEKDGEKDDGILRKDLGMVQARLSRSAQSAQHNNHLHGWVTPSLINPTSWCEGERTVYEHGSLEE